MCKVIMIDTFAFNIADMLICLNWFSLAIILRAKMHMISEFWYVMNINPTWLAYSNINFTNCPFTFVWCKMSAQFNMEWWILATCFCTSLFKRKLHVIFFLLWCLCCMMMFRRTNKQPGLQKFWNLCGHYLYQDVYDWISPLNKRSGLPFILTQQSMGRNE